MKQTTNQHEDHLPHGREARCTIDEAGASSTVESATMLPEGGVGAVGASTLLVENVFEWSVEDGARRNYAALAEALSKANPHLYRNGSGGHGLILVRSDGTWEHIKRASQLAPVIVDALSMRVLKAGKVLSELPPAAHLNAMLRSNQFLRCFAAVDQITTFPVYDDDYALISPGYRDHGDGKGVLYLGKHLPVSDTSETIERFLNVMAFDTPADRTNAVAAALTVLLRGHWFGQKPLVLISATKSHAGKGTTADFIRGNVHKADILFQSTDWPMQSQFQRQFIDNPEIGVINVDNVRLDSAGGHETRSLRSAWIESFVTNAEMTLASPGAGDVVRLKNRFVFIVTSNDGSASPDILNRSLPIHLTPKGDVHERRSPIGDPKLEFLPKNIETLQAELRGMIERWRKEGRPLDENVKHPMSVWARTVGGILKVSGFKDFLENYERCRSVEDPIRNAMTILAGIAPGKPLTPLSWAEHVVEEGLVKTLFRPHQWESKKGQERAIGLMFKKYVGEYFTTATEKLQIRVRLDGGQRRWGGKQNPHTRYVFTVV